jgi:prolipoprotein diacylglyceryltransferase
MGQWLSVPMIAGGVMLYAISKRGTFEGAPR